MLRKLALSASRSTRATVGRIMSGAETCDGTDSRASRLRRGEVLEAGELAGRCELDDADRTVALLADDELGHAVSISMRLPLLGVHVFPVDEHDHVGILLERTRFPQVRELRAVVRARLGCAAELGEHDDR